MNQRDGNPLGVMIASIAGGVTALLILHHFGVFNRPIVIVTPPAQTPRIKPSGDVVHAPKVGIKSAEVARQPKLEPLVIIPVDKESPAEPESWEIDDLPEYAVAKTRKAKEPIYVRAVASDLKPDELKKLAMKLREEVAAGANPFVVDWFKTSGPLAWSGTFSVSRSARANWVGRVRIEGDDAKWSTPNE